MFGDKKGLSTIVVTLIIILISLVAVGIVWVVVRNLINSGTNGVGVNSECLNVDMETTVLPVCSPAGGVNARLCNITLQRQGTGNDVMGGIKLLFENATTGAVSPLQSYPGNIQPLGIANIPTNVNSTLSSADTVVVTVYFTDSSGNQQVCQQSNSFKLP